MRIMTMMVIVLGLVVATGGASHAQHAVEEEKSPNVALGLSLGTTAAGAGLVVAALLHDGEGSVGLAGFGVAGMVVGPSLGHAYAGQMWNVGLGVRLVSAGTFTIAGLSAFSLALGPQRDDPLLGLATAGMIGSAVVYSGAMVYEIATAPRAARRCNENRRRFQVVPLVGRDPGVVVAGSF